MNQTAADILQRTAEAARLGNISEEAIAAMRDRLAGEPVAYQVSYAGGYASAALVEVAHLHFPACDQVECDVCGQLQAGIANILAHQRTMIDQQMAEKLQPRRVGLFDRIVLRLARRIMERG